MDSLKNCYMTEMSEKDMQAVDGGVLPLVAIAFWGTVAQLACCGAAVGAYMAYKANK